jgi:hypothetical protein
VPKALDFLTHEFPEEVIQGRFPRVEPRSAIAYSAMISFDLLNDHQGCRGGVPLSKAAHPSLDVLPPCDGTD